MDSLFRHIDTLDTFEAEQELDLVDGRVGGHLLQDRPERLLNILAERDALDDEARQVNGHSLVRLKHEPSRSTRIPVTARRTVWPHRTQIRIRHRGPSAGRWSIAPTRFVPL